MQTRKETIESNDGKKIEPGGGDVTRTLKLNLMREQDFERRIRMTSVSISNYL